MAPAVKQLCLALALFACAGAANAQARVRAGDVAFEELPPQALAQGRCGLFLWARGAQPVFMFFASDQPAEAKVRIDGRARALARTAFDG